MSTDKFPWDEYKEGTKDINKYPTVFEEAVWNLNDKPFKQDQYVAVFMDKYPAKDGHRLYIPKIKDSISVGMAFQQAYRDGTEMQENGEIDGFNLGMNIGATAGQSIFWPHVHFIPRTEGDQDGYGHPRGVRQSYPPDRYDPNNLDKLSK